MSSSKMELCIRIIFLSGFIFGSVWCYSFRLPNDTIPVAYDLKITPDFGNNNFTGNLSVTIRVVSTTQQIVLHARNLTINKEDIEIVSADELFPGIEDVNSTEIDVVNSLFIINTVNELMAQLYVVNINYTGIIQEEMAGFSKASYNANSSTKYIGVTHFEPTHARSVFPCYDEPRYRTNFTLEVSVPISHSVISNVPVTTTSTLSNGLQSFYFQGYRQMPTYLLAWVIYDHDTFSNVSTEVSGITINTWARQGLLDQVAYANSYSGTILTTLWSYLRAPFGKGKIDQVTIPNFFIGAMENWGLITYAEESLLFKTGVSTTRDLQAISLIVAHELSHQWFGDLVTVEFWNYPWIKEAFAQYFQYNTVSSVQPSWQLADQMVVNLIQPALELDSTPQHALNNYNISSEKQIRLMFDDITYNKGAGMIRMLQSMLGEEAFRLGLETHFKSSQASGVTNPEKLWNSMRRAANNKKINLGGGTVEKIMAGWTDNPGHPVLSIQKTADGLFNITQKRFLHSGEETSSWWIPVTYTTQSAKDIVTQVFLPGNSVLIVNITDSSKGWVLFNVNQTGLYRVNYDEGNWHLLSRQLQSDLTQIPRLNRAQLLDDLFNFARGGFVSYSDVLSFSTFLRKEVDYFPWVAAFRNFGYLLKRYYAQPAYKLLQQHILSLMEGVIADVGFQETPTEGHLQRLKRSLVLEQACALGHSSCISNAVKSLRSWKNGFPSSSVDIQIALLCTAVQHGSSEDWDFVFQQYLNSAVPTQRAALLSSLTCSQNATKLNEFLDNIITNSSVVSSKEFLSVMKLLSSKPVGAVILLDYLFGRDYCVNNSLSVPSDYNEEVLLGLLAQITPQLTTKEDIMKLDAYSINGTCLSNHSTQNIQSLVTEGLKVIQWQEQYNSTIYDWLYKQTTAPITVAPPQTTAETENHATEKPATDKPSMSGQLQLSANIILCIFISFLLSFPINHLSYQYLL